MFPVTHAFVARTPQKSCPALVASYQEAQDILCPAPGSLWRLVRRASYRIPHWTLPEDCVRRRLKTSERAPLCLPFILLGVVIVDSPLTTLLEGLKFSNCHALWYSVCPGWARLRQSLCPFDMSPLFFEHLYFVLQDGPVLFFIFPAPAPESSFSLRNPASFTWRIRDIWEPSPVS